MFIDFVLSKSQKIKLKVKNKKRPYIANYNPLLKLTKNVEIEVDDLFFTLPKDVQKSIIYHEQGHRKNNLIAHRIIARDRYIRLSLGIAIFCGVLAKLLSNGNLWYLVSALSFLIFCLRYVIYLLFKKIIPYEQEYQADEYAVKMNGKKSVKGMILALQRLVESGIILEDLERHPSLKNRMTRINSLRRLKI